MTNYREKVVTGSMTKYTRCNSGSFYNAIDKKQSSITFTEEEKVTLPDGTSISGQQNSSVYATFNAPEATFDLLDNADKVIGTAAYKDVYTMLYSLYRHEAKKRDDIIIEAQKAQEKQLLEQADALRKQLDAITAVEPTVESVIASI
jgi:hypothetical protein